jgi:hypothetical protein
MAVTKTSRSSEDIDISCIVRDEGVNKAPVLANGDCVQLLAGHHGEL